MILIIEGPRHSGKTHLLEEFFKQNTNPNVIYYKFYFAKYIDQFGFRDQESGSGVHYFSLGNILSIFELNQTLFKDKVIVFDRCLFSAYVWSIYRKRMKTSRLHAELEKILQSELYSNISLLYLDRDENVKIDKKRDKDYFGNFENYSRESEIFAELLQKFNSYLVNGEKKNTFHMLKNGFNEPSVRLFNELMDQIINKSIGANK
jgi:hypothetical protein